jgi:hypothetical protein
MDKSGTYVATKSCDLHKFLEQEANFTTHNIQNQGTESVIGSSMGTYRRNMAHNCVQQMAASFGCPPVFVKTSAGILNEGKSNKICMVMDFIDGETVEAAVSSAGKNGAAGGTSQVHIDGEFMRWSTWMQLLDVLTGQCDRHGANVMLMGKGQIGAGDGRKGDVTLAGKEQGAIDHEISFPTSYANTLDFVKHSEITSLPTDPRQGFAIPPVIDQEMGNFVTKLNLGALEKSYKACGLTKPEIECAIHRARLLKQAVLQMHTNNAIINKSAWGGICKDKNKFTKSNCYAMYHTTQAVVFEKTE